MKPMANIYKFFEHFTPNDPNEIKTYEILRDKKGNIEIKYNNLLLKSELVMKHFVTLLLLKTCEDMLNPDLQSSVITEKDFSSLLEALLSLFKKLAAENVSRDLEFSRALSSCWVHLNLFYEKARKKKTLPDYLKPLSLLILSIKSYPLGSEHSLEYYLLEHAGEKWLPFPYISLLHQLHEEAKNPKAKSNLKEWIAEVENLLKLLGSPRAPL